MKRILFYLFFLVVLQSCGTLKETKRIELDFAASQTTNTHHQIVPGQTIELVLKNINPYVYDISIKDSLITYKTEVPPLFAQAFKLPDLSAVPPVTPTTVPKKAPTPAGTESFKSGARTIDWVHTLKTKEAALDAELKKFVDGYKQHETTTGSVLSYSSIADDLAQLLKDCYSTPRELTEKADNFILARIKTLTPGTLPLGIQTAVAKESASVKKQIDDYLTEGNDLRKKLSAIATEARTVSITKDQYLLLETALQGKIASVDKLLENARKLNEKLSDFDKAKVGTAIETNYTKVKTSRIEKTFFQTTKYSTDEVLLDVTVKKKQDVVCLKEVNNFPVKAIVKGGVKIDFSTGFVFNMSQKKFFDQSFRYDSVYRSSGLIADSVSIRRNTNNNVVMPSLGAFLHVYTRTPKDINFGGMVGASLGTDQRAYTHFGACLLIGKSDRLIIGGGISVAKAKMLSGSYYEGQIIRRPLAPTEIPREDVTRIGGFASITWNLNIIK